MDFKIEECSFAEMNHILAREKSNKSTSAVIEYYFDRM
jgi:hypothetical protein